jgi:hypothetical protein
VKKAKHTPPGKPKVHPVHNVFTELADGKPTCNICSNVFSNSQASNLMKHLSSAHPNVHK